MLNSTPTAHNVSIPGLSMITNNDIKVQLGKPVLSPKKLTLEVSITLLVVGETKLDDSFPQNQFKISGFSLPYRLDRNRNEDGVMISVREELPSKGLLQHIFPNDIEALVIEINLRKTKFLLLGWYSPSFQSQNCFFDSITKCIRCLCWKIQQILTCR